jgi:hypothetical protein
MIEQGFTVEEIVQVINAGTGDGTAVKNSRPGETT